MVSGPTSLAMYARPIVPFTSWPRRPLKRFRFWRIVCNRPP